MKLSPEYKILLLFGKTENKLRKRGYKCRFHWKQDGVNYNEVKFVELLLN